MLKSVLVRDHMTADLIILNPEMDILQAVHTLIRNNISGAPVVNADGDLVGILTERDCMHAAMQSEYYAMPGGPVSNFMTSNPKSVSPVESILKVAQAFIDGRFHRYPVVKNGHLVGVISRRDVMRALGKHYPL